MITCVRFFRLLPPRENPVNTIFGFDVHLQHVLHVGNKKFTYLYKGITSPPNRGGMSPPIVTSTSGFSLPRARLPPLRLPLLAEYNPPAPCASPPLADEEFASMALPGVQHKQKDTAFRFPRSKLVIFWEL